MLVSSCSSSSSAMGKCVAEARALKVHCEAEKRRRERINRHLSTLRRMIPDANKMDKASLLGRVLDQVKNLKRRAEELGKGIKIPPEVNEVIVECPAGDEHQYLTASISCDDRPDLFADLIKAFHDLRLRTIQANLVSIGGRAQHVFVLCTNESNRTECLSSLKESIEEALARIATPDMMCNNISSKRQRILESNYSIISL
ncbi:transcription factor bHLH51-like [Typha latifolia]|uniref:transcription factor bHLH51-like n=1 Tax=Typha latifolia TaxID=4733 RepID=UPI003C2E4A3E